MYKCCYNCSGGSEGALREEWKDEDEAYYKRVVDFNKSKRICTNNPRDNGHGKDAFIKRYCKLFEPQDPGYGPLIDKDEADTRLIALRG